MKDERKPAFGYVRMSTDQQQDSPARQTPRHQGPGPPDGFKYSVEAPLFFFG
jgi:hypothetical protein